jgi:hypothetical protein
MILTRNEVSSQLKQLNKSYISDEYFRNALNETTLLENQALANLEYDYGQAVNQAYAASMDANKAIQNSALGTGYKEAALVENQNALLDAFNQYKQNYVSNKQSVIANYDKINQSIYDAYQQQEEKFASQAETFIEYWDEYYNYADWLWKQGNYDIFENGELKPFTTLDEFGAPRLKTRSELFDQGGDGAFVTENGELTNAGKHYLDVIENARFEGMPTFGEYLSENNRDLWNWASEVSEEYGLSGAGLFREATGRGGDYESKYSSYDWHIFDVADKWTDEYVKLTKDNVITYDYLASTDENIDEVNNTLSKHSWKLTSDAEKILSPELFKDSAKTLTDGQAGSNRAKTVKQAADAAMDGKLKNGTLVDINRGGGVELWCYWNGKFYKLEKESTSKAINSIKQQLGAFSNPIKK